MARKQDTRRLCQWCGDVFTPPLLSHEPFFKAEGKRYVIYERSRRKTCGRECSGLLRSQSLMRYHEARNE